MVLLSTAQAGEEKGRLWSERRGRPWSNMSETGTERSGKREGKLRSDTQYSVKQQAHASLEERRQMGTDFLTLGGACVRVFEAQGRVIKICLALGKRHFLNQKFAFSRLPGPDSKHLVTEQSPIAN